MSELTWIFQNLGGKRAVGKSAWKSALDLHRSIVAGLPVECAIYFKARPATLGE